MAGKSHGNIGCLRAFMNTCDLKGNLVEIPAFVCEKNSGHVVLVKKTALVRLLDGSGYRGCTGMD